MEEGLFEALKPAVEVCELDWAPFALLPVVLSLTFSLFRAQTCDQQIKNVIESQSILQTYVNGLAQELKKSRVTDLPPLRASHVSLLSAFPFSLLFFISGAFDHIRTITLAQAKLTATKKRLDTVGVTVKRINTRLENIRSLVRKRGPIGPELTEDSTDETKLRQPIPPLSDLLDWQDSR